MLPILTHSELLGRLQRSLDTLRRQNPAARPVLASDADGTLWSGDVGDEGFARVLRLRALKPAVAAPLREVARRFGVPEHDDPHEQAEALALAYEQGRIPERDAYMIMAWIFAGYRTDEVVAFAEALIQERGGADRHHPEMLPVLEWARREQVEFWIVSASPQLLVEQGAIRFSVPRRNVLAMRPCLADGLIAPGIEEPATYAEGKAEALRRFLPDATLLAAFGDNTFDIWMFHMAEQP
ncbi:MAG: haloacid dehalogenase-like hydrolase, partial [Myxococcales bacterium]|nr:haloacid dehalogenase-like hydrolase [Polyangiaceae bacterium]MDW8251712.1 haloacid dehalogenase-like hydrolase [Myxococcales bacterium]